MEIVALYINEFNGVIDSFINVNSSFTCSYNEKLLRITSSVNRSSYYDKIPSTLLIGQNGCGKTTILTFIEDFYYDNENSGFIVWYDDESIIVTCKGISPSQITSDIKYSCIHTNAQDFSNLHIYTIKSNNTVDFNSYLFGKRKSTARNFIDISLNSIGKRNANKKNEVDKILKYIKQKKPLPDTLANRELSISAKLTFGTGDTSKKILKNLNFKEKYEEELSVFFTSQINNYRGNYIISPVHPEFQISLDYPFVNRSHLNSYIKSKKEKWGVSFYPFIFSKLPHKNNRLNIHEVNFYSILSVLYSFTRKLKVDRNTSDLLFLKLIVVAYFSSQTNLISRIEFFMKDSFPRAMDDNNLIMEMINLDKNIDKISQIAYCCFKYSKKTTSEGNTVNYFIDESNTVPELIEMSNQLPKELDSIFNVEWDGLSSGEVSLLHILSSISYAIESVKLKNGTKSILLLLDEIDLYLHPEWQRTILSTLLNLIKSINNNVKVQIIMSSHSPIIASDFLSVDIVTLLRSTKKKINTGTLEEVGYGESIDKMMSQGFFLKSTVGDRVLTTIDFLIKNRDNKKILEENEYITSLIKNKMLLHVLGIKSD